MPQLQPDQFAQEVNAGKFRPVYYLTGEEKLLKERALAALVKAVGPDAFNFSAYTAENFDVKTALSEAITHPVMAERRMIVVKGADALSEKETAALADYVRDPSPATVMVVISDARREAGDPVADGLSRDSALVDFEPMQEYQAERFVADLMKAAGRQASPEALSLVVDMAGTDALALANETEKLLLYRHGEKTPISGEEVMESAGFSRGLGPFEFTNALQARNGRAASELLERMFAEGVEPIRILSSMTALAAKLLRVKRLAAAGLQPDSAAWAIGMSRGQFNVLSNAGRAYTAERLSRTLGLCLEADAMLKSSSGRNPRTLLKQLVFEMTRE